MVSQSRTGQILSRILLALCVGGMPVVGLLAHSLPEAAWPLGVLLLLAAVSALATLHRSLQLQNVLVATAFILFISGAVVYLNVRTSIPFGPLFFTDRCGEQILDGMPATLPLLWLVILLTARGVARLILRPWRKLRTYGFRLIGLTCLLTAFFDLGLEPFAVHAQRFWLWQPTAIVSTWHGMPWINFFGWFVTALLILAFVTPWLINKQPAGKRPPDLQPLVLWLALNLFLAVNLATREIWSAAAVVGILTAISGTLAWRNARW